MRAFILRICTARRSIGEEKAPELGAKKPGLRLACGLCLLVCLLVLVVGCGRRGRRSAEHVEVSGLVLYKGKPVQGGQVTFVTTDGFSSNGIIDEKGHYTIKAPVGNVKISVVNTMLQEKLKPGMTGAGPAPGGDEPTPIKGTYREIPSKYYAPDTSGLTYTVTNGPQTHDIVLTD